MSSARQGREGDPLGSDEEEKQCKTSNVGLNALQLAVELLVLLQEEERGNGMGTQPDEARYPAPEGPGKALLAADIPQKDKDGLAGARGVRGAHDASLDHIDGTADGRCDETGHKRGREVRAEVVFHTDFLHAHTLEDVVGGELGRGHEDCAGRVWPDAAEKSTEAFRLGHLHQTVEGMSIVAALIGR